MKITELESRLKTNADTLKMSIKLPGNMIEYLKEREEITMRKKFVLKRVGLSAATVAAAFVLLVNCAPGLAHASSKIPILGEIVRVVTFGRYEVKNNTYEANVVTPKIEGLLNKALCAQIFRADANIGALYRCIIESRHEARRRIVLRIRLQSRVASDVFINIIIKFGIKPKNRLLFTGR